MGIFKFFKKSRGDYQQTPEEVTPENVSENEERHGTTTTSTRRNSTFRRRLSTGTAKKLRRIGQCVRGIGDDVDRRSKNGSTPGVNHERGS